MEKVTITLSPILADHRAREALEVLVHYHPQIATRQAVGEAGVAPQVRHPDDRADGFTDAALGIHSPSDGTLSRRCGTR